MVNMESTGPTSSRRADSADAWGNKERKRLSPNHRRNDRCNAILAELDAAIAQAEEWGYGSGQA